jgi:Na+-driven multidrug efflux pump
VSWATLGVSIVAAFAAAPWGLVGVLYGISAGWLARSLIATWMALPHLRRPRDGTAMGGFARHG